MGNVQEDDGNFASVQFPDSRRISKVKPGEDKDKDGKPDGEMGSWVSFTQADSVSFCQSTCAMEAVTYFNLMFGLGVSKICELAHSKGTLLDIDLYHDQ